MIKPDGIQRSLIGKTIKRFEAKGLKLVAIKFIWVNIQPFLQIFYEFTKHFCMIFLLFFHCSQAKTSWKNITSKRLKCHFVMISWISWEVDRSFQWFGKVWMRLKLVVSCCAELTDSILYLAPFAAILAATIWSIVSLSLMLQIQLKKPTEKSLYGSTKMNWLCGMHQTQHGSINAHKSERKDLQCINSRFLISLIFVSILTNILFFQFRIFLLFEEFVGKI